MKRLFFICGPNGVGKSVTALALLRRLPNSTYVDIFASVWLIRRGLEVKGDDRRAREISLTIL